MRGPSQHEGDDGRRPSRFEDPDSGTGAGGGRAGAGPTPTTHPSAAAGRGTTDRPPAGPTSGRPAAPRSGTDGPSGDEPVQGDRSPGTADDAGPDERDADAPALPAGLLPGGILDGLLGARADPEPEEPTLDDAAPDPVPGKGRRSSSRDDALIDGLAHRAAAGDRAALHDLLRVVDPLVVRYCRAHTGGNRIGLAGPDDVAQEVMVAVCKALPSFDRSRSVFMAFVYGIASNKIADAYRAAARDRSVSTDELPEGVDLAGGPEAEALRGDAARHVSTLLARLPESGRMILVYRLALNYSAEETAALVGMTPGAVRVAQHRALQKLREWIANGDI